MQQTDKVILSTSYFPPVQYFTKIISYDNILIETHEHYTKQSYRNRCKILSPNGIQTLSIPIIKISGKKQKIKDVKIDYKNDWQNLHLKSIKTAYLSSPFFEYYIDSFLKFFKHKYTFLYDLNFEILSTLLKEMQIEINIHQTQLFSDKYTHGDFRYTIHPKEKFSLDDIGFNPKKYTQVFFDKFEFVPNLSVLDLLFNEGPNSENLLRQSSR